jgi:hypothetical protein
MKKVPFVKAYPGISLHNKITNRGIMEELHLLSDLNVDYDHVIVLRTRNQIGETKHHLRFLEKMRKEVENLTDVELSQRFGITKNKSYTIIK